MKILEFLYEAVVNQGGDGAAVWVCEAYKLQHVCDEIVLFNRMKNTGWGLKVEKNCVIWGENQESVTIYFSYPGFIHNEFYEIKVYY
jgi:hypothetical protein